MTNGTTGAASGRLLLPHHRTMLEQDSAINGDVIAERGYYSIQTRKELKAAGGSETYADHLPALGIPIYGPTGEHVYTIVRYDDPPTKDGQVRKYLLPHKAQARLDVPKQVRHVLGDPSVALTFTEGSRKVDSLVSAGINAVGLTGVWQWRGTNDQGGKAAIADLQVVAFNDGREIPLLFDSDIMFKDGVYLALSRFSQLIRNWGAHVTYYYLPSDVVDGELVKVGIDDWLAKGNDIRELQQYATRTLRPPPGATPPGGGGGPEQRAQVHTPPQLAFSQDILALLTADMHKLGHVGEERVTKLVYLAVTSRLLSKIVSVAIKGPSAAGKSATVERVLAFFPGDTVIQLTGMSEHFLAYDDRPIKHKMLVLFEAAGLSGEHATYLIRTLLSEGVIRHGTVESLPEGLQAREVVREGPAGLITTTTEVSLHPENETRLLSITVDDSAKQTKSVMLAIAEHDDETPRPDLDRWHTLQHWLEDGPRSVAIPYATELVTRIPPIATRLRRDAGTLLTLVRAHALLHRATRELRDGKVIATLGDYSAVRDLVAEIISHTLGRAVSPATREIVGAVAGIVAGGAEHATYARLAAKLELDRSTVNRRGRVAVDGGYLRNLEDKRGRPARLVLGDPLPEDVLVLPTVEQVEQDLCRCAVESEPPPTPNVAPSENGRQATPEYASEDDVLMEEWRQGRLDLEEP